MPEQFGDKTQEATPYRRQKAREEGQVAHSQDLSSAALLVGATLVLMYFGRGLCHFLGELTREQLGSEAWVQTDVQTAAVAWNSILVRLAQVLLPFLGWLMLLGDRHEPGSSRPAVPAPETGTGFQPHRSAEGRTTALLLDQCSAVGIRPVQDRRGLGGGRLVRPGSL